MVKKFFRVGVFVVFLIAANSSVFAQRAVRPPAAFVGTWHHEGHISGTSLFAILEIGADGSSVGSLRAFNLSPELRSNSVFIEFLNGLERERGIGVIISASNSEIVIDTNGTRKSYRLVGQSLITTGANYGTVAFRRGQHPPSRR